MATTVGEVIFSDDMIVAQSDEIAPGTIIESLVISFDEAKYEEFVSSGGTSPASARKYRKISCNPPARATKATDLNRERVHWVAK